MPPSGAPSGIGLSWDDCYDYLHRLGFDVKVELLEVG